MVQTLCGVVCFGTEPRVVHPGQKENADNSAAQHRLFQDAHVGHFCRHAFMTVLHITAHGVRSVAQARLIR